MLCFGKNDRRNIELANIYGNPIRYSIIKILRQANKPLRFRDLEKLVSHFLKKLQKRERNSKQAINKQLLILVNMRIVNREIDKYKFKIMPYYSIPTCSGKLD